MKKTAFTQKDYFLGKKKKKTTSVYHIKTRLLTASYMKCQRCSRNGKHCCQEDLSATVVFSSQVWGDQSGAPTSSWRKSKMPRKRERRRKLQCFPSISNQKKEQGQNALKQLHKKKSETKEHSLTSLALKTCQIKDNMQMRVPL